MSDGEKGEDAVEEEGLLVKSQSSVEERKESIDDEDDDGEYNRFMTSGLTVYNVTDILCAHNVKWLKGRVSIALVVERYRPLRRGIHRPAIGLRLRLGSQL